MDEQEQIIQVIAQIPAGSVCTYGVVATRAGLPGKSRYVGFILKNLPEGSKIPWHRVINSQGKISFPAGSEKYQEQKDKLAKEGVTMLKGKYNLKDYLWAP